MSQQPLDLRRSVQIVRRHRFLVSMVGALGLLAGIAVTALAPPMLSSQALVVLSPSVHEARTQVLVADSDPVLAGALRHVNPGGSLEGFRSRVQTASLAYNVISITVSGTTAAKAESAANAVAGSYVAFLESGQIPGGPVQARILAPAADASGMPLAIRLLVTGGLGALAGVLVGAIAALAIGRSDRRLHDRDDIAESVGVPVLASIPTRSPSDAVSWRKLLEDYRPRAADAWRLRKALQDLDLASGNGSGASLAVLSLSSDRNALALGPQLAAFAASMGIPTALVVGPQQDARVTASLRAACAAPAVSLRQVKNLRVAASDNSDLGCFPGVALTIAIAVVDGKSPEVADTARMGETVLGVSAGAATADQLARVAASAAADGRHIAGIFIANPDSADQTYGRLPHLMRPVPRTPMTTIGTPTETRR